MCRNDIVLILLTAIEFVNLVIRVIKLIPPSETTKLSSASEPKIEGLCPANYVLLILYNYFSIYNYFNIGTANLPAPLAPNALGGDCEFELLHPLSRN